ncbi:MAG: hypothetical protein JNJ71_11770 [Rubrivivax sp.]|nr:hypothetical protein [Rubrivivax sp.]
MTTTPSPPAPPGPLDFLQGDPQPVPVPPDEAALEPQGLRLPQAQIDALMAVPGVQGVWVEGADSASAVVVVHVDGSWQPFSVPRTVLGWPVRIHRGGPIRAL